MFRQSDKKINRKMNNKGQVTIFVSLLIVGVFLGTLFILVGGLITVKMYNALNQDVPMGQVNLQNVTRDSFGYYHTMFINSAEWWGVSLIFGLILGLFIAVYATRGVSPKWGIILDIFIILAMFIFALYISSAYVDLLDALDSAGEPFLETHTPRTSMFISNLHIFVAIIGVICMVIFHSSIPRKTEERIQSGGFLRGVG